MPPKCPIGIGPRFVTSMNAAEIADTAASMVQPFTRCRPGKETSQETRGHSAVALTSRK